MLIRNESLVCRAQRGVGPSGSVTSLKVWDRVGLPHPREVWDRVGLPHPREVWDRVGLPHPARCGTEWVSHQP